VRSRVFILGDFEVMAGDVSGRLKGIETGQRGLLDAFQDHESQDERRFADISTRFDAGQQSIRLELAQISRAITEAISGDSKTEGLRERVRTIETQHALREADMRWLKRTMLATVAGLISSVLAGAVLFFVTKGGIH